MKRSWKVPSGPPVELTVTERHLANDIRQRLASIMERIRGMNDVKQTEIDEMGTKAHLLHMSLKKRGHAPKHHKYMLENRELAATHVDFYKHVHPVEDLLRFIENENANDDPVDVTVGHEFEFRVFSRRWGHDDHYTVTRIASGWRFSHMQEIEAGRDGRVGGKGGTGLFHLLDHDMINYPEELPGYFEWLWEQAAERGLTHDEVQEAVQQLADWVSACERASPGGAFEGFK